MTVGVIVSKAVDLSKRWEVIPALCLHHRNRAVLVSCPAVVTLLGYTLQSVKHPTPPFWCVLIGQFQVQPRTGQKMDWSQAREAIAIFFHSLLLQWIWSALFAHGYKMLKHEQHLHYYTQYTLINVFSVYLVSYSRIISSCSSSDSILQRLPWWLPILDDIITLVQP